MNINKVTFNSMPHTKVAFSSLQSNNISSKSEVDDNTKKSKVIIDVKSALKKIGAVVVAVVAFLNRKIFSKIGKKVAPYIKKFVNNIKKQDTKKATTIEELSSPKTFSEMAEKIEKPLSNRVENISSHKQTKVKSSVEPKKKSVLTRQDSGFSGKNDSLDFDSDDTYTKIMVESNQTHRAQSKSETYDDMLRHAQDEAMSFELFE